MNVETDAETSKHNGCDLPYSVRIKIKNVPHYRRCVGSLKEHGFTFISEDMDELTMRRSGRRNRQWLYLGLNRHGYVFFAFKPVKYAREMTRKEVIKWLQTLARGV